MYKENKDITLQYYNQNAGSFVSGTVHADLTDTLNRFLSRLDEYSGLRDTSVRAFRNRYSVK